MDSRTPHPRPVPSAEDAARIVAARRAAERRALERREARRLARLRADRDTAEARRAYCTLRQSLLIGSKLVDLSGLHPGTLKLAIPAPGARPRIVGRAGGLKQYLADACPTIRYSTAMRYRQLALRLLRVLGTPPAVPLEWLLGPAAPESLAADAALAAAIRDGRRELAVILAGIPSQRALTRYLDRRLDPDRLPLSRRGSDPERDAAVCQAVLDRCEGRLREDVASGRPLTRDEKRAGNILCRLERLTSPPPRP